jgi:hypothetical protein
MKIDEKVFILIAKKIILSGKGFGDKILLNSETGPEVNFKAFGIYYDMSVECHDPNKDPHCTDSRFLMQLVDSLKLALIEK